VAKKAGTPVCLVRRTTGVIPAVVRPSTSGRAKTGRVPTYRPPDPGARGQTADFHRHGWRTEPGTRATSAASRAEARELLASAVRGPLDDAVRDQLIEGTSGSPLALQELPGQLTADQLAGTSSLTCSPSLKSAVAATPRLESLRSMWSSTTLVTSTPSSTSALAPSSLARCSKST
jgi:hypothetical protein